MTGLKPLSKHYAYFEEVDVSAYITPDGGSLGGQLTSDANGSLTGTFAIPEPSVSGNPKWRCGERVFKITDSTLNHRTKTSNESYASAKYRAQGLLVTEQETIYATRVPEVIETKLLEENALREVTDSFTYNDGGSSTGSDRGGSNRENRDSDGDGIPDFRDADPDDSRVRHLHELKNREEQEKKGINANYNPTKNQGGWNKNSGKSIICTQMYRTTGNENWERAMKLWYIYQQKFLTMTHQEGYHWMFGPFVKGMKRSKVLTKIGSHIAQRRTNHIKHILLKTKPDYLGKLYMTIGEPVVYLAGKVLNIIKGKK